MNKSVMRIGILSKDDYRKRAIAIAKGEYRPKKTNLCLLCLALARIAESVGALNGAVAEKRGE